MNSNKDDRERGKITIDRASTLQRLNGNQEVFNKILALFFSELPRLKNGLLAAGQQEDWEEVYQIAHKLHGSCCYIIVPPLKDELQVLCEQMRERKSIKNISRRIAIIIQMIDEILKQNERA